MPTDEQKARVERWIGLTFYYIGAPKDRVDPYWWKDREGKMSSMEFMSLDHLKASSTMVKKNIESFENSMAKDLDYPVYEKYILKHARKKLEELQDTLREKIRR